MLTILFAPEVVRRGATGIGMGAVVEYTSCICIYVYIYIYVNNVLIHINDIDMYIYIYIYIHVHVHDIRGCTLVYMEGAQLGGDTGVCKTNARPSR